MDHVGPAVLLAQPVVARADVEEKQAALACGVGGLEQHLRGKVGDDQRDAAIGKLRHRSCGVVPAFEARRLDRERLVEELTGCIVILDRELRTGDAVVGRGLLDERDRLRSLRAAKVSDLDVG